MAEKVVATFRKDPDAVMDYGLSWSTWLDSGETITSSTWTVPAGITKDSETFDDDTTLVWLSGGDDGQSYRLTDRVSTSASRTTDRSILIIVGER